MTGFDLSDPIGAESSPLQEAHRRPFLRRFQDRLRTAWEPVLEGFHEHDWTGKLFLMSAGAGLLATIGGIGFLFFWLLVWARSHLWIALAGPLFLLPFAWLQWKLISGVARFRRWACYAAIFASLTGAGGGAGFIGIRPAGGHMLIALVQVALTVQFVVYFIRNRDRFDSPPRLDGHL